MLSPFGFEEAGHLHSEARPSTPCDSHKVKSGEGVWDFLIVLAIVAVFAGALYFLLPRKGNTPQTLAVVRKERWKDWRPLDD
jgi:hypothetical protein